MSCYWEIGTIVEIENHPIRGIIYYIGWNHPSSGIRYDKRYSYYDPAGVRRMKERLIEEIGYFDKREQENERRKSDS
jgi:hypothetical protein